jgi:hypothetical protein
VNIVALSAHRPGGGKGLPARIRSISRTAAGLIFQSVVLVVGMANAGAALAQTAPGMLAWPPMGTEVTIDRSVVSGSYGQAGGDFGGPVGRVSWKLEQREWKGRNVVAAEEDVTTPAGTFKAFKVSSINHNGWTGQQWVVPSLELFG